MISQNFLYFPWIETVHNFKQPGPNLETYSGRKWFEIPLVFSTHQVEVPERPNEKLYFLWVLLVLRFLVHPVSCHFSCQKLCNTIFFVKSQHSLLDFCHLTIFFPTYSWLLIFYDFKLNFPLEAGQILEGSQWIQIL